VTSSDYPIQVSIESDAFVTALAKGEFKPAAPPEFITVLGTVDLTSHPMGDRIEELPDVTISGDLIASGHSSLRKCRCNVLGKVELDGSMIEEFVPANIVNHAIYSGSEKFNVTGRFSAQNCPKLEKISGVFLEVVILDKSSVRSIQNDLHCRGDLSVASCHALEFLNCHAHRIIANKSSIREFGASTTCKYVSAEECPNLKKVTKIEGLQWAKYNGSAIEEISPDFRCSGSVFFHDCPLLKNISGRIHSVEVSRCALESVTNLTSTEMIISNCEKLPAVFSGVSLQAIVFASCSLQCLPAGLPEKTNVRIGGCENFCHLPAVWAGDLSLSDLSSLEGTPARFRCEGNVDISECSNMRKIEGRVGGDLWLMSGTENLKELNSSLEIGGDLRLAGNCGVRKLNCSISRDLIVNSCEINETGSSFTVLGNADFQG